MHAAGNRGLINLTEKLKNSKYGTPDSLDHITKRFDETTKRLFRDSKDMQFDCKTFSQFGFQWLSYQEIWQGCYRLDWSFVVYFSLPTCQAGLVEPYHLLVFFKLIPFT